MSQQTDRNKSNRAVLVLVIAIAIGVHSLGIGSLQGMKILFDSPKKAWFEQQHLAQDNEWDEDIERMKLERTKELATI